MAEPRVLVLRAPGTNCDVETADAFLRAGAAADRVHVNRLIENPALPDRYQILCLPGGFSYGDDIAAGAVLATRLRRSLGEMIDAFVDGDRLVLGICNGMQVLMRLGVLTAGVDPDSKIRPATLTWNDRGRFEDRWVHLAIDERSPCVFTRGVASMYLPMAHAEGKFVARDADALDALRSAGRLPLRYARPGATSIEEDLLPFPDNPNGGDANVAGVCDVSGRVFGLMPHPERHVDPLQHPSWTRRRTQPAEGDGMAVFRNAVAYFG